MKCQNSLWRGCVAQVIAHRRYKCMGCAHAWFQVSRRPKTCSARSVVLVPKFAKPSLLNLVTLNISSECPGDPCGVTVHIELFHWAYFALSSGTKQPCRFWRYRSGYSTNIQSWLMAMFEVRRIAKDFPGIILSILIYHSLRRLIGDFYLIFMTYRCTRMMVTSKPAKMTCLLFYCLSYSFSFLDHSSPSMNHSTLSTR